MSLNYDFTKIANADTLCWETRTGTPEEMTALVARCTFMGPDWSWTDDNKASVTRMSVTTHCLIWAAIHVGLSEITHENWQEFFERLSIVERLLCVFRTDADKKPVPFTPEDVKSHIGLRVNVGNTTKREFHAKVVKWVREDARKLLRDAAQ